MELKACSKRWRRLFGCSPCILMWLVMQRDSDVVLRLKMLIRYSEAKSAARVAGANVSNLHFLNMPFYQTGPPPSPRRAVLLLSQFFLNYSYHFDIIELYRSLGLACLVPHVWPLVELSAWYKKRHHQIVIKGKVNIRRRVGLGRGDYIVIGHDQLKWWKLIDKVKIMSQQMIFLSRRSGNQEAIK